MSVKVSDMYEARKDPATLFWHRWPWKALKSIYLQICFQNVFHVLHNHDYFRLGTASSVPLSPRAPKTTLVYGPRVVSSLNVVINEAFQQ